MYNINDLKIEDAKKEAITTTEGPLLIIAGPGAGKTMTLVERIVYLVAYKKIEPDNILVATFTEKAAQELITRVSNRLLELDIKVNINEMYIGTLHSIFLKILEENREYTRLSRNYKMLDQFDQNYLIYENLDRFISIDNSDNIRIERGNHSKWEQAKCLVNYISKVAEENIDVSKLTNSNNPEIIALGYSCQLYSDILEENNALDFTAIQTETLKLINKNTDVLNALKEKIKYLMIDEYQDTNTIQEKILFLLLNDNQNICVVGDDDQGLYRFRGATIRNILEFPSRFNGRCKQVKLETNYRSHPSIINFYNQWMNQQVWEEDGKKFRYDKKIVPQDKSFTDVQSVFKVVKTGDYEDWHHEVLSFIQNLKEDKILNDYNQIAFLFKSVKNDKVIELSNYLERNGINVFSPRSALFFDRVEIQLVIGAIVFMFPKLFEILEWKKGINYDIWGYYRECARAFANEVRKDKHKHADLLAFCNDKAKKHTPLTKSADYSLSGLFYQLLKFDLFRQYVDVDLNDKVINQREAYNLSLFSKLLNKFEHLNNINVLTVKRIDSILQNFYNQYLRFLYDGGIEEYEDFDEYAPSGCVSFMTIHQSKGLEFPIVFVDSLNAVPRKQHTEIDLILQNEYYEKTPFEPIDKTKFYDFWRLYYTAFSRAQNLLILTGRENKSGRGLAKLPSLYFERFYDAIPNHDEISIAGLELDKIKPTNIKKEYAFTTDILLYENCPLQYKFYNQLEFSPVRQAATLFGVLVHQTIEDIHKSVLKNEPEKVNNENIESWFNQNYIALTTSMRQYLGEGQVQAALNQVKNYKGRHEHEWHLIKEAEVDISLVKEEYILKGTVDLIKGENDTVEIIDFKSQRVKPDINSTEDRELLERYRRQLEVYSHIVEERTGQKVSKMHLYYTGVESGSPYITYDKDNVNINSTIKEFDRVVSLIENKNYDMSQVKQCEKLCGNCDMRFYCKYK